MIADTQVAHVLSRSAWLGVAVSALAASCMPVWAQDSSNRGRQQEDVPTIAQRTTQQAGGPEAEPVEFPELSDEEEQLERWFRYYELLAQELAMRPDAQPRHIFQVCHEPILRYTNHYTLSHGGLYIWTLGGRPEAVGAIWSNIYAGPGKRSVGYEMHSLSQVPFIARRHGTAIWTPRKAGIELQEITDSPAPTRSPDLRLVQMRELAHNFAAYRTRGQEERMRLMEQPLYRYDVASAELLDGALFVFFDKEHWDPEVFLIIEARLRDGKYRWHCAGARLTNGAARLEYRGQDVWKVPPVSVAGGTESRTEAYFGMVVGTPRARIEKPQDAPRESNPLENLQLSVKRLLQDYGPDYPLTQSMQRMLRSAEEELQTQDEADDEGEPGFAYVDLQPHANFVISGENQQFDLANGRHTLGRIPFKFGNKGIRLAGSHYPNDPKKVEGISVGLTLRRLHVIHATKYGSPNVVKDGTHIGQYEVLYKDGFLETIPVVYGEDVRDWWNWDDSKPVTRGKVVWTGETPDSKERNIETRLYLTTWDNPRPDREIVRINYASIADTAATPFCVAMTAEVNQMQ